MERWSKIKRVAFIPLIKKHRGCLAYIAEEMGVTRGAVAKFLQRSRNKDIAKLIKLEKENTVDKVEDTLIAKALKGDTTSQIFFLKTQAKHRGYADGDWELRRLAKVVERLQAKIAELEGRANAGGNATPESGEPIGDTVIESDDKTGDTTIQQPLD